MLNGTALQHPMARRCSSWIDRKLWLPTQSFDIRAGSRKCAPEAVIVTDAAARQRPAMCYIAWQTEGGTPTEEYIGKIVSVAREFSFPEDYVRHIRSFIQPANGRSAG